VIKRLIFFISLLVCASSYGQTTNLIEVIKGLEKSYHTTFSYNETLLRGVKVPEIQGPGLTNALAHLSEMSAFEFKLIDDENVLVKAREDGKNLKICVRAQDVSGETLFGATVINKKTNKGFSITEETQVHYINLQEWDSVHVRSVGYVSMGIAVDEFNGSQCVNFKLLPSNIQLEDFTVTAYMNDAIQYNHMDQSISFTTANAGLLPGETETDILVAVQAIPGIKSPDGKAGNLIIRGDDPDKSLVTFDDIPIYHSGHYFGAFSPFNANVVESVSIFRSGYGAEKGGRVGGAIELKSKQGVPDKAEFGVGASTSYLTAYANVPIKTKKFGLMVAGRSSYPFEWNSPKINAISDFIFQSSAVAAAQDREFVEMQVFELNFSDVNAKATFEINDKNTLSASFMNIYNDLKFKIADTRDDIENETTTVLKNWGINFNHTVRWNNKVTTENSLTASTFYQIFEGKYIDQSILREEFFYENTVTDFNLKTSTTVRLRDYDQFKFGYSMTHHNVSSHREIDRTIAPLLDVDSNAAFLHAFFASYSFVAGEKFQATLGARGTYYSLLASVYGEPRLSMNYRLTNSFSVKTNLGVYNQFVNHLYGTKAISPSIENYNWRLSDGQQTPVVSGKQGMFGFFFEKNGWVLDAEVYVKNTENITIHNQYDYQDVNNLFHGDYYTKGIDVMLKKSIKNMDMWIGYTYSTTMVQFDSIQPTSFPSIWSQPHVFNAVVTYKKEAFKLSAGWKFSSGLATLDGIRYLYMNGPSTIIPPPPGAPPLPEQVITEDGDPDYGENFPSVHQLDISASYKIAPKPKKWNCNIGVSVLNLYDNKAIIGQVFKHVKGQPPHVYKRGDLYGMGRAPSLMVMFTF